MGNNPVAFVDPDGGYSKIGSWIRMKLNGGYNHHYNEAMDEWGYYTSEMTKGSFDLDFIANYGVATNSGGEQVINEKPFIKSPYGPECESSSSWKNLKYQWNYHMEYKWTSKQQAPKAIKMIADLNPLVSLPNGVKTLSTGVDIYDVEVSDANRYIGSSVSIITTVPGVGTVLKLGDADLLFFNIIVNEATK
jgi:hypothetical protein